MHFPLSLTNAVLTFFNCFLSVFHPSPKKRFFPGFLLISLMVVFFATTAQAKTYSVTNHSYAGSTTSCADGTTFGNGELQNALNCAAATDEVDTVLIQGGLYNATLGRPEPYYGSFGIPWNSTIASNHLVKIEGRKTDWSVPPQLSYRNVYSHVYSKTTAHVGWWDANVPVVLDNSDRKHYKGNPMVANLVVGFSVIGSNRTLGIPVSIANIQFEGENIGIFIKGDATDRGESYIANSRISGYGCGESALCNESKYGHGIAIYGGSKITIINNEISTNYDGLAVADKDTRPIILGNYILYNKRNGIGVRNDASPIIGPFNGLGNRQTGKLNLIMANYLGIGCRDRSYPTIANNYITGNIVYPLSYRSQFNCEAEEDRGCTPVSYNRSGIGAKDYSSPWIYGNLIDDNRWGGIINMDFTTPYIGPKGFADNSDPALANVISDNSRVFNYDNRDKCNVRGEVEGRAAIGSKDAAAPTIVYNKVYHNGWAGIGNKDWAMVNIHDNRVKYSPVGIVLSNVLTTELDISKVYSNFVDGCSESGIAVRDSGNVLYRVQIYNNTVIGHISEASAGIGVNHSYVSIYNNTVYGAGVGAGGGQRAMKSAAIGIRNGSDVIIARNRITGSAMGVVVLGSKVEVVNNLITENWSNEVVGVWLADNSIGVKVNHNLIVGNQFLGGKFKGSGILVQDDAVLREAKYNLIHAFEYGIRTFVSKGGHIEEGAVDYNLFTTEVAADFGSFSTASTEEDGYPIYYWDERQETYVRDYPGPHTHYLAARYGISDTPYFVAPGVNGSSVRDFNFNTDPYNPILALVNSDAYSVGLTSDFPFVRDYSDLTDLDFGPPYGYPSSFQSDIYEPDLTVNSDIRMVKTTPEPNSTNASTLSNVELYLRDIGDGIDKNSIGVTIINNGISINNADDGQYFSYEPSAINTSSWYKVSFDAFGTGESFSNGFSSGQVKVLWYAADIVVPTFNENSGIYSFQVNTTDFSAPYLDTTTMDPPSSEFQPDYRADKQPYIKLHIKDTYGINPDTISLAITETPEGGEGSVTTTVSGADVITNTDPTDTIVTYTPSGNFDYKSLVTVAVTAEDYDGNYILDSLNNYSFTIMNDNFAPEDAQALHVRVAGTNGAVLSWIRSVDSENDLQDQVIYYCDNWDETINRHVCYGKDGTDAWNWQYWNGVGPVVESVLVDELPEGKYLFMLETEDERGTQTHPDFTENFSTDVIESGDWIYQQSANYLPQGRQSFTVNNGVLEARASTASGNAGESHLMLADYYPSNFYLKFRFATTGQHHGAYLVFRHNIGEVTSLGGHLGTSGYLAYVYPGNGDGAMGFRLMPDPITKVDGCSLCESPSMIGDTAENLDILHDGNTWYEVRIIAYNGDLRMELWGLQGGLKDGSASSIIDVATASEALRYRYGEIGFYEPTSDCLAKVSPGNKTEYDDVEIEWYGVLADDVVNVRGGHFKDDFTGFEDNFSGDLASWTINGHASWNISNQELLSGGVNGELISFGYISQTDFKASAQVSMKNATDDSAYILFRRQYRRGIGKSGYLAALESNGVGSEVGFYKITSSGLVKLGTWQTDEIDSDLSSTYTMELEVTGSDFKLQIYNAGASLISTAGATDGAYSGGMVGLYRGNVATHQMEYDDFALNDMISNDWETNNTAGWEVSLTESTLSSSFVMQNLVAAPNAEVLVKDLILSDSFMFEGDMLLSDADGSAAAFYFQKQSDTVGNLDNEGESAYGLVLKIDPAGSGGGDNVYFFKVDENGIDSTLSNGSAPYTDLFGGFDIPSNQVVHVKIVASGANMPTTGEGGYSFAAYLSTTEEKPYIYEYVTGGKDSGSLSNMFRDGQAGFYLPDFETPATLVNVDNVVIGPLEHFAIPREETGSTAVTFTAPGDYGTADDLYSALQSSINNIGDVGDCAQYIKLDSYTYNIGDNVLDMGECVAIRGNGISNTTIQGSDNMVISFNMTTHKSSLMDLTVSGNGSSKNDACIWIVNDSPMIKNVKATQCWDGIRIGGGLHDPVNHPARPTITASYIVSNHHIGIGNNVASDAWILNNRIFGNEFNGIGVLDIAAPRIEDNIIGSSCPEGDPTCSGWSAGNGNMGIGVRDNSSPLIIGNYISVNNIGGIGVRGNATPNIIDNTIVSNGYGVMAYEWAEPFVYYNVLRNNASFGNSAQGSVIWEVRYNEISHNYSGIGMSEDATGFIEGNYIFSNSLDAPAFIDAGIRAQGGADTSIFNNWLVDNGMKGIAFMDTPATANIAIRYNYIARNGSQSGTTGNYGISVVGSNLYSNFGSINNGNFHIRDNVIAENADGGVGFSDFGGTLLFQNNIIVSNTATHTSAAGIGFYFPNNADITILGNTFYNNQGVHAGGIGVTAANNTSKISIMNNKVYWNSATASDFATGGIGFMDSLGEIHISGNVIHSNTSNATDAGIGMRWINLSNSVAGAIRILDNVIYSHNISEAALAGMGDKDVEGLNGKTGIGIRNITFHNTDGIVISGNTIRNNTTGIRIRGDQPAPASTGPVSLSNNVISSSRLNGILVQGNGIQYPTFIIGNILNNSGIVGNGGRAAIRTRNVDEKVIIRGNYISNFGKSGIRSRSIRNARVLSIEDNVVGNLTGTGIGVTLLLDGSSVSVSNNLVYSVTNPTYSHGENPDDGGISISTLGNSTNTLIYGNELRQNNSAAGIGGMGFYSRVYNVSATGVKITLDNNLIWGNIGSSGGGVGFTNMNAIVTIKSNSIFNNTSTSTIQGVGGIGFSDSGGSVNIDNNVIYSNTTSNTLPE